jgi:hypothetical protein
MPAPPSTAQKEANAKSMAASKSYGGINTSTVSTRSTSTKDQSRVSPSSSSDGGRQGDSSVTNNTSRRTSDVRKSSNTTTINKTPGGSLSILQRAQQRVGISTPTASGSPKNNPAAINAMVSAQALKNKAIQRAAVAQEPRTSGIPTKQFPNDRLAGYTGPTPPTPGYNPAPGRVGPSYGRGGINGLQPTNANAPLADASTYGPETPAGSADWQQGAPQPAAAVVKNQSYKPIYGGFSLDGITKTVKDFGKKVGEGMQKINKIGAGTVMAMTRQPTGPPRRGEASGNQPWRRRKVADAAGPITGFAKGGAVEKFMTKYPDFKLT